MKHTPLIPRAAIAALACLSTAGVLPCAAAKTDDTRKKFDTGSLYVDAYVARRAGAWDSDIWQFRPDGEPLRKTVKAGDRPTAPADCEIHGNKNTTVTLSTKAAVLRLKLFGDKTTLVIDKGGELSVQRSFFGSRGSGATRVELKDGRFQCDGLLWMSGASVADTGTCAFRQTGGTAQFGNTLFLTGNRTLSCSPRATGVYTLNGGLLRVRAPKNGAGICKGIGNGLFYFGEGTLDTDAVGVSLENVNGGNLSPGGDDAVGETRLYFVKGAPDAPQTCPVYTQGANARFTVNLENRKRYDRLVWRTKEGEGRAVFKSGAVLWIAPLGKFRLEGGQVAYDIVTADTLVVEGTLRLEGPGARGLTYEADTHTLRLRRK